MIEERAKRKLSAILSADVKGYSRLMGEDELATIETLKNHREQISTLVDQFNGRVVDSPGDNLLAEFGSVVDAVECAVKVQEKLKKENDELPENRRMEFRIGVNLGDVVEDGRRIYGEGVNIAARIEGLAEAGGICISRAAYDQIKRKLNLRYDYIGEHEVKNIDEPVRIYKILMEQEPDELQQVVSTRETASVERMAFPLPDKPSIAVLPFTNMSGDPSQEYIGDGFSENIISALSISSNMFVIARNSTFTYKEKPVKVQKVAEEMGVQYVLEGSVQKSGDRLRVTAQLIDALSGHHLWTERYDRKLIELFDLQDEITRKIVTSLQVKLTHGEAARWAEKSTENFEAWSYFVRGRELYMKFRKEDNAKARELFEEAIKLDPGFGYAWGVLGGTHLMDATWQWSESPVNSMKLGSKYVQKSLELDEKNPAGHGLMGHFYLVQGHHDKAVFEHKKNLSLHPNHDMAHFDLALTMFLSGRFEESIELIEKAMRLSPYYPAMNLYIFGRNHIFLRRFEEAISIFTQLHERCKMGDSPFWHAYVGLAERYWELGREEEARDFYVKLLRANPKWSLQMLRGGPFPFKDSALVQSSIETFRKIGALDKPSIAVLPFVNMSNDPEQEYFSDGMTEELIGALAKLEDLKVISRTSAFYFKGKDVDLRTIGEKLKVDNVLEGSVRKSGNKLRISAQLIKVADDTHLWSETYDRELKDVFDIQEEISQAVVENLKVRLLGMENGRLVKDYTNNTEAYDLFLMGRFFEAKGFIGQEKAIEYYEKTIKIDPDFAPAYSDLVGTHFRNAIVFSRPSKEMFPKVKALVLKALEIDELHADAHAMMGIIKSLLEYDWKGAEISIKRAIELNPGSSYILRNYAVYLITVGRANEAIEKMEHALELDPFSSYFNALLGMDFYFARQLDKAIAQSQKTLELDPNEPMACAMLALSQAAKGIYDEGITMLQKFKNIPLIAAFIGYIYFKANKREEAQEILNDLLVRSKHGYFSPYLIAAVYAGLGERDNVFEWLEKAYDERDTNNWCIKLDPMFDNVHSDPRWKALMERMGLAD